MDNAKVGIKRVMVKNVLFKLDPTMFFGRF